MIKKEIKTRYLIGEEFELNINDLKGVYFIGERDYLKEAGFCDEWLKKHKQKPRISQNIQVKTDLFNRTIVSAKLVNVDYTEEAKKPCK